MSARCGCPTRLRKATFVGRQAIELQKGEVGGGDLQTKDRRGSGGRRAGNGNGGKGKWRTGSDGCEKREERF